MNTDELSLEIGKQTIALIPQALKALLEIGARWCSRHDLLHHSQAYKAALEADCSKMQILGMEQPVPLESIYTEVRIITRVRARMFKTIDELEAETLQEVRERTLDKIQEQIFKRLEENVQADDLHSISQEINKRYNDATKALQQRIREHLQELCAPTISQMPFDHALNEIRSQYEHSLAVLKEKQFKLDQEGDSYRKARTELNEKFRGLKGDYRKELALERSRLKEEFERTTESLKKQIEQAQRGLDTHERPYNELVYNYEREMKALYTQKKAEINKATREIRSRPLTEEERRSISDQMESEVEKELQQRTKRELTEKVMNDFGHATQSDSQAISGWDAVQSTNQSLILGKPGAGKTTFLKHIVLKNLTSSVGEARLPIFIPLREYAVISPLPKLLEFIVDEFATCGFPKADEFVENILNSKYKCVVLFDGLDEVSQEQQADIVRQIVQLSRRFRHNQYIVSCRTANYRGQLEGFTEFEIAEFGPKQVADFAEGWFGEKSSFVKAFLIDLKRHTGLQELTTTPLLLALLCIGYRRNQRFPDQKALIYLTSLDALLVDWDSSKQLRRHSYIASFDPESKKQLLGKVACDTFCENRMFFTQTDLIQQLETNSQSLPIQSGKGYEILREYVENHGLLVERAKGIFSFSHLTIQEFLTAFHISRFQRIAILEKLADEAWKERRWEEVVVFLGGLLPEADAFLVCLRNRLKEGLKEKRFANLFLGQSLPEAAETYILKRSKKDDAECWKAWFRWRIFEYRLYEASYGQDYEKLITQMGITGTSKFIAQAAGLTKSLLHDLALDRPLNQALRGSLEELPRIKKEWNFNQEMEDINNYLSMAKMIAETLASEARVLPALRVNILNDIGTLRFDKWDYPEPAFPNILGA